jgi:mannose/fructose/N-acetylgalactosamine-specific phosphotransferase system component IIC
MPPAPLDSLLPLALLGAFLGLDVVSFPQAMISRPLVAATLAGALLGDAGQGLLVGATLEMFALETLPVGASRYPEWGSASVVAGALYSAHPADSVGAMCLAVLFGVSTAWLGGYSMIALRKLNGRWARNRMDALAAGSARTVVGLQIAGFAADLVRGFALTLVAFAALSPTMDWALATWATSPRTSQAVVAGLAATVAAAAVWKLFHAVPRARLLFVCGLAIGTALVVFG